MRFSKFSKLFVFLLFAIVFLLFLQKIKQKKLLYQYNIDDENKAKQILYDTNFAEYCEKYGEWEMILRKELYIKRSAVFYFADANILRIPLITLYTPKAALLTSRFNFRITLKKGKKLVARIFVRKNVELHKYGDGIEYLAAYFQMKLTNERNLERMFANKEFDSMRIAIIEKKNARNMHQLDVKVKYLIGDRTKNRGMMHCSKCMYTMKKEHVIDFEWYIKLHKKMGYEKRYFCAQMVEKGDDMSFSRLLKKYKDYLEIDTLVCIPNLQPHAYLKNDLYLKHFTDLTTGTSESYERTKYYALEYININECYMNNVDKYRYVTIADTDEFVLVKQIRDFDTLTSVKDLILGTDYGNNDDPFAHIKCDNKSNIVSFLQHNLMPRLNTTEIIDHDTSLHFKYGNYITNGIAEELFSVLQSQLKQINFTNSENFLLNVSIEETKRFKELREFKERPYRFTISGQKELAYAKSLMQLYETSIRPFLIKQKQALVRKVGSTFDRLFFVSGEPNYHKVGKSIVSTRRSIDVFIHFALGHMRINERNNSLEEIVYAEGNLADADLNNKDFLVPRELAHLSHYRETLNYDEPQSVVPFSTLHFDLNYFKCYLIPMLSSDL